MIGVWITMMRRPSPAAVITGLPKEAVKVHAAVNRFPLPTRRRCAT
jgi:hypothetical protein